MITWYAGDVVINGFQRIATPIEFGATNLISSDPIKHSNKGAIGSYNRYYIKARITSMHRRRLSPVSHSFKKQRRGHA